MYKDNNQLNLIKEVHEMTYDEAYNTDKEIRKIGSGYWLATAYDGYGYRWDLDCIFQDGNIGEARGMNNYTGKCLGIRPVVTMNDGVYIVSGTGTESDPYVLGKDE